MRKTRRVLKQRLGRHAPAAAGLATLTALLAAIALLSHSLGETLRDVAFDLVLASDARLHEAATPDPKVIVVDIDRQSIDALGAWPWPRTTMARLVDAAAGAKPAAIAIDVLFAEPDDRSPAALARTLGSTTGQAEISRLADSLPDGDKLLAQATGRGRVALGFVLDPERDGSLPHPPIVSLGPLPFDELWQAAGAIGPTQTLAAAADGLGALSLPGSRDGAIRQVPVFVAVGGALMPGLAAEALRLASDASSYLIKNEPAIAVIADRHLKLPRDGLLRLIPSSPRHRAGRTMSARDLLERRGDPGWLTNAVVLIGGSAPELNGLRKTPRDPLMPSVQIQADAVEQMIAGRAPDPMTSTPVAVLTALSIGILAVVLGTILSPALGSGILGGSVALLWIGAVAASVLADRLVDPLTPSIVAAVVFAASAGSAYSMTRRREALLQHRLEQHLSPAVVRRIVDRPDLLKLDGERREVTSMFTDIEGFTATMHRAGPEQLVETLDLYFEGLARLVIDHGGMVDKIVGDGMHALFNAPVDLEDHARRAVECAIAIRAWSESFRRQQPAAAIGLGRTRAGLETGPAIVGDVGIRSKLNYTAHGDGVNMAARLEACNKELGSAICVGPETARQCDAALLRPLGSIQVRGRDEPIAVFEPWPDDAPPQWRQGYLEAHAMLARDRAQGVLLLQALLEQRPGDLATRRLVERASGAIRKGATA